MTLGTHFSFVWYLRATKVWPISSSQLDHNSWSCCFSSTHSHMLGLSISSLVLRSLCIVLQANKNLVSFLKMVFFSVNTAQRACLNVCTNCSAIPFVAGWYGAGLISLIPLLLMNEWVCCKLGVFSLTNCSGKPCVTKSFLSSSIVLVELVVVISITLGHLECTSTMIRNIVPKNGPPKSTCIRCHGCAGHFHALSGAVLRLFWVSWQPVHHFTT